MELLLKGLIKSSVLLISTIGTKTILEISYTAQTNEDEAMFQEAARALIELGF